MSDLIDELTRMEGYFYQIWNYQLSLSILTIRATHKQKKHHNIHITFSNVQYFQFPSGWDGDFYPASDVELLEILGRVGVSRLDDPRVKNFLKEINSLYKADSPNSTIYILGHLAKIEYDVEPIYN